MGQTNIQVPIEQRNHDEEVLRKRKILYGPERHRSPGPSSLGTDDRPEALCVTHGGSVASPQAPDLLYGEQSQERPRVMSGRRHPDQVSDLNQGRNVGSTHLDMPAEPHMEPHTSGAPGEGTITLPKDQ